MQEGDTGGAVRIVLDLGNLGGHAVLVPTLEIDETVLTLVAAAAMTGGDTAVRVTTADFAGVERVSSEKSETDALRRPAVVGL